MIGGLQGEFGDLDIKYLKQNISKCRWQISGSFRRTPRHCAKYLRNSPGKCYQRIRICLTGEVETPSSPIRRQAPDAKYSNGMCRMWDIRVECRHSRIPDVRHPGGMAAQQNSGCDTSGWNGGALPYPDHHTRTIAYPIRICCPDTMHILSGYVVWMKTLTKVSKHNPRYTPMVCPDALSGHLLQGRSHTPCIPDLLMAKDFKASVSSCF